MDLICVLLIAGLYAATHWIVHAVGRLSDIE